jgi:hypothetical protein
MPLNGLLSGGLLILAGLALILFQERIRRFNDRIYGRLGSEWTSAHSRSMLLLNRIFNYIVALFVLACGVLQLLDISL